MNTDDIEIGIGKAQALISLVGSSGWQMIEDEVIFLDDFTGTPPTTEELVQEISSLKIKKLNTDKSNAAKKILAESDWYIIRNIEKGNDIPQSITNLRDAARLNITEEI